MKDDSEELNMNVAKQEKATKAYLNSILENIQKYVNKTGKTLNY